MAPSLLAIGLQDTFPPENLRMTSAGATTQTTVKEDLNILGLLTKNRCSPHTKEPHWVFIEQGIRTAVRNFTDRAAESPVVESAGHQIRFTEVFHQRPPLKKRV
jgi:hypothetical protein